MPEATHSLTQLTVEEGSLVDKGDNPGAEIKLVKRDDAGPFLRLWKWARGLVAKNDSMPRTTGQVLAQNDFEAEFGKLKFAFMDAVYSILEAPPSEATATMLRQSVDEFAAKAKALFGGIHPQLSEITDSMHCALEDVAAVEKRVDFVRAVHALDALAYPGQVPVTTGNEPEEVAMSKSVEDVLKSLPEADRALVQAAMAPKADDVEKAAKAAQEVAELAKRLTDTQAELAKMRDERMAAEFQKRAEALKVPGQDVAQLAEVLKRAHAADPTLCDTIEQVLKAAAAQAEAGGKVLFKSIGTRGTDGGNAESKIASLASELQKANPKLSKQQAVSEVLKAHPALYQQSLAEAGQ